MLELAVRHPRTNAAEQALIWLVTNNASSGPNRGGPGRSWRGTTCAAIGSSRSSPGGCELHWASQAVEDLLRNALEQNPYREIRGLACYWLAEFLKYRAEILRLWPLQPPGLAEIWRQRFSPQDLERVVKQDPKALEHKAARLYDRVITEFPFVANNDSRTEQPPLILGRVAVHLPVGRQGPSRRTATALARQARPRDRGRQPRRQAHEAERLPGQGGRPVVTGV